MGSVGIQGIFFENSADILISLVIVDFRNDYIISLIPPSINSPLARIAGTEVRLLGATQNTTCGSINSPSGEKNENDQTYTLQCPATEEPTLSVFVIDHNVPSSEAMHLSEVMVYGQPGKYIFPHIFFFFLFFIFSEYLSPPRGGEDEGMEQ
jgi:hypothetical protein